jgi:CheY-like chemotaxis protein
MGTRVLVVEDDVLFRNVLEALIADRGHEVVGVGDGAEAWALLQRELFPLVLLDWVLPPPDGLELCRRLRQLPGGELPVVLMVTGRSRLEDLAAVLAGGADDYLAKPFDIAMADIRLSVAERQIEVRASRARLEAERTRLARETADTVAQLEAILDVADEAIVVYAPDGRMLRQNRFAREALARRPDIPAGLSPAALHAALRPLLPDGRRLPELPLQTALRGQAVSIEYLLPDASGRLRRLQTHAAPILDDAGNIAAAVVIWRDITEMHDAIATRARLDGAVKTARRVAHELNNQLSCIAVYGDLLGNAVEGEAVTFADEVVKSVDEAAAIVARLQNLMRFEETEVAGVPMLDLSAATVPTDEAD